MASQFLSKTNRDIDSKIHEYSAGPGSYEYQSSINVGLPGFAAFATSSSIKYLLIFEKYLYTNIIERSDIANDSNKAPPPGTYEVATNMINVKSNIYFTFFF